MSSQAVLLACCCCCCGFLMMAAAGKMPEYDTSDFEVSGSGTAEDLNGLVIEEEGSGGVIPMEEDGSGGDEVPMEEEEETTTMETEANELEEYPFLIEHSGDGEHLTEGTTTEEVAEEITTLLSIMEEEEEMAEEKNETEVVKDEEDEMTTIIAAEDVTTPIAEEITLPMPDVASTESEDDSDHGAVEVAAKDANDSEEADAAVVVEGGGDCATSHYGCCPDEIHPAHGGDQLGCCAYSEFSCCSDGVRAANDTYGQGCECELAEFGCCPDAVTPATGPENDGCGCQYSPHGCCPDQSTRASGDNFNGCSCDTYEHGCCPDKVTPAKGHNFEGCLDCNSQHGCCPDGVTPRRSDDPEVDGCGGCEASLHGCCLDGVNAAFGPDFQGCPSKPGEVCHLPSEAGPCADYASRWFYDPVWGGCNRFWYGGCQPGQNHFDEEEDCKLACERPRGSAVCYLKKVTGPCDGKYTEWYFDREQRRCAQFVYSGCLGNGNRFETREICEGVCGGSINDQASVCQRPKAEGACQGNFARWFYDFEKGRCEKFSYSGCLGNNNRFMTEEECEATCSHKAKQRKSDVVCKMPLEGSECNSGGGINARWGYDVRLRKCAPFYFRGGCGGNDNNFKSREDCESVCPITFPPVITLPRGSEQLAERRSAGVVLWVTVRANPPPKVRWVRLGRDISGEHDSQYEILPNFSLRLLLDVLDSDAGTYTVVAENGIGPPVSAEIEMVVYPIHPIVSITADRSIFKPESVMELECKVKAFPPPRVEWLLDGEKVREDHRVTVETYQTSTTSMNSRLVVRDAGGNDSGTYRCQATSEVFPRPSFDTRAIRVQFGPGERCVDRPAYKHCAAVVRYGLCEKNYYGQHCCRSCTRAGFIPGGTTA